MWLFWRLQDWLDTYFGKWESCNVLASICHTCLHLFGSYRYTCQHHHKSYQLLHLQNICILKYVHGIYVMLSLKETNISTFFELYLNNWGVGRILTYSPYIGLLWNFLYTNRCHWHHNLTPLSHRDHIDKLKYTFISFMMIIFYSLAGTNLYKEERNRNHLGKHHISLR